MSNCKIIKYNSDEYCITNNYNFHFSFLYLEFVNLDENLEKVYNYLRNSNSDEIFKYELQKYIQNEENQNEENQNEKMIKNEEMIKNICMNYLENNKYINLFINELKNKFINKIYDNNNKNNNEACINFSRDISSIIYQMNTWKIICNKFDFLKCSFYFKIITRNYENIIVTFNNLNNYT